MDNLLILQSYLIDKHAPKEVCNALRSLTEDLQQKSSDADDFLRSLGYRDQDVVRLEGEIARLLEVLELSTVRNAWKKIIETYQNNGGNCLYCGCEDDEPHDEDCKMITIIGIDDGGYNKFKHRVEQRKND